MLQTIVLQTKKGFTTAFIDQYDKIWIGDRNWGLVEHIEDSNVNYYQPEGPINNTAWSVDSKGRSDLGNSRRFSVTLNSSFSQKYFSGLNSDTWETYNENEVLTMNGVFDIIDVNINPNNTQQVFLASWNGGLIEKKPGSEVELYHEGKGNSIIHETEPDNYKIGGVDFDNNGNLWMTNSNGIVKSKS